MKAHELLVAIIHNDPEAALFETGRCLYHGDTDELLQILVSACAFAAETITQDTVDLYLDVISHIKRCIDSEKLLIRDAFQGTLLLCFLFGRSKGLPTKTSLPKLKDQILPLFPDKASLSKRGEELFGKLLPSKDTEEYTFSQRILAGLSKLFADKEIDKIRYALEYLSRKRYHIAKPRWLAPQIGEDQDIIWILWGAVMIAYSGNVYVATLFDLFCLDFKKSHKLSRAPFLWIIPYVVDMPPPDKLEVTWSHVESQLYHKVTETTVDLWKQIQDAFGEDKQPEHEAQSILETYMPRGMNTQCSYIEPFKEETKSVKVRRGGDTYRIKESSSKVSKTETSKNNETYPFDPRYRGFDYRASS